MTGVNASRRPDGRAKGIATARGKEGGIARSRSRGATLLSDVFGCAGRAILTALVEGHTDPARRLLTLLDIPAQDETAAASARAASP